MPIPLESGTTLLMVWDVPTSLKFWRDVVGFSVLSHSPPFSDSKDDFGWALLVRDGIEIMLNNAYENNRRPGIAEDPARLKAHADTCLYFACRDVDAAFETLRSAGIVASAPANTYYGMRQTYTRDPDGYGVCFQWEAQQTG